MVGSTDISVTPAFHGDIVLDCESRFPVAGPGLLARVRVDCGINVYIRALFACVCAECSL